MFYRRKIILGLLEAFGGELPKISLQKLLLLITQEQEKPQYDFIPYKFGCYSFSANADLNTMVKKGMLSESKSHFYKVDEAQYFSKLKDQDKKIILSVRKNNEDLSPDQLMKLTYVKYPYWAINSTKAKEILTNEQYAVVQSERPKRDDITLFTIGYEGISLEEYLNRLLKNDVKLLIDVRNNPLSMKFGFSKTLLTRYCNSLGIDYLHLPEVGIQSEHRQALETQADYDKLFRSYCDTTLKDTVTTQKKILDLLIRHKRVAMTCFEADICQCHRKHLAESITSLPEWKYNITHI